MIIGGIKIDNVNPKTIEVIKKFTDLYNEWDEEDMTDGEERELRERCLDRAAQYWINSGDKHNTVDVFRTAKEFFDYIKGKDDDDD